MDPLDALASLLPAGSLSRDGSDLGAAARDRWTLALLRERRGAPAARPRAVVLPASTDEVATTLAWASETRTPVVPRGAGSGVSGGAQATPDAIVLDVSGMDAVLAIDEVSPAVHVQAGARGDRVEDALGERRLTLGHYPQSLAISTVGGWIAASSAGQASAGFGVIEGLVLGLTVVLATGEVVRLRDVPRSAAGPDLRRLFVGSEGTLGVITEAVLSAARRPSAWASDALRPPSFQAGIDLARELVHAGAHPLVLRLYDEPDATLAFGAVGHGGGPVLLAGWEGHAPPEEASRAHLRSLAEAMGGADLGEANGPHWWAHRNDAVQTYERVMGEERLLGPGAVVDTMEVAALWSRLPSLYEAVGGALRAASEMVGCHLSHPYRSGASLYFTFLLRGSDDLDAEARYLGAWEAAIEACHGAGGTMTHHHGVGLLKAAAMEAELGPQGLEALRRVKAALDPEGILNPGKLLP